MEVVGDPISPSEIIIPTPPLAKRPAKIGAIIMSGGKLWVYNGSIFELVTSVA